MKHIPTLIAAAFLAGTIVVRAKVTPPAPAGPLSTWADGPS